MIAKNCTEADLRKALDSVNERYQGNIRFKSLKAKGKRISFTLTVQSTQGGIGCRRGWGGHKIAAACWHVHGHFFEELFRFAPDAMVLSNSTNKWITKQAGNWQDKNIGSIMQPLQWSQACDCKKESAGSRDSMIPGRVQFRTLSKAMIMNCPLSIFDPDHYKEDGTCLCYDQAHQAKLKAEREVRKAKLMAAQKVQKGNR